MSKSDKKPDAPKSGLPSQRLNRKAVPCIAGVTPEETALNFANLMISPEMASFRVITNRERSELMERLDTPALIEALRQQTKTVHKGDLQAAEAMLMNQATALQSLFVKLAETGLQAAQGGDAGDDTGLFGERGKSNHDGVQLSPRNHWLRGGRIVFLEIGSNQQPVEPIHIQTSLRISSYECVICHPRPVRCDVD